MLPELLPELRCLCPTPAAVGKPRGRGLSESGSYLLHRRGCGALGSLHRSFRGLLQARRAGLGHLHRGLGEPRSRGMCGLHRSALGGCPRGARGYVCRGRSNAMLRDQLAAFNLRRRRAAEPRRSPYRCRGRL